jgi:hypothetical protein
MTLEKINSNLPKPITILGLLIVINVLEEIQNKRNPPLTASLSHAPHPSSPPPHLLPFTQ